MRISMTITPRPPEELWCESLNGGVPRLRMKIVFLRSSADYRFTLLKNKILKILILQFVILKFESITRFLHKPKIHDIIM